MGEESSTPRVLICTDIPRVRQERAGAQHAGRGHRIRARQMLHRIINC